MKVICKLNEGTNLRLNYEYLVLELFVKDTGKVMYRILPADKGTPPYIDAFLFDISDESIPQSWVVTKEGNSLYFSPKSWSGDGFWEDYFNDKDYAIKCFNEEVEKMQQPKSD